MRKIEEALDALRNELSSDFCLFVDEKLELLSDARTELAQLKETIKELRDTATESVLHEAKVFNELSGTKRKLAQLKEMLREIEWVEHKTEYKAWYECPSCKQRHANHSPSCQLNKFLKENEK